MSKDNLGDRIKNFYENAYSIKLTRKCPVIIRLDGKAFHTFTKHYCSSRFDEHFSKSMQKTAEFLLSQIQGSKIGFVQSDEISILITDYDKIETGAWFEYKLQKMCSVSASMATIAFNDAFFNTLERIPKFIPMGMFDSRCFNIPKDEVMNYFIWRQQDCIRNSINTFGQMNFSHKELQGKNCNDIHELLYTKGKNWATDLTEQQKNGTFYITKPILTKIHEKVKYDDDRFNSVFNF